MLSRPPHPPAEHHTPANPTTLQLFFVDPENMNVHLTLQSPTRDLTDQDRADLARLLRDLIDADRYPFSPRVRRLKELLAQLDTTPAPAVCRN